jgi:hypothetical protein
MTVKDNSGEQAVDPEKRSTATSSRMGLVQLEAVAELDRYDHERAALAFGSHVEVPAFLSCERHRRLGDERRSYDVQCAATGIMA